MPRSPERSESPDGTANVLLVNLVPEDYDAPMQKAKVVTFKLGHRVIRFSPVQSSPTSQGRSEPGDCLFVLLQGIVRDLMQAAAAER